MFRTTNQISWLRYFPAILICGFAIITRSVTATSNTLILATYNIHTGLPEGQFMGKYRVGTDDLDRQTSVIQQINPNIIAMQEVDCEYGYGTGPLRARSSYLNEPRYFSNWLKLNYAFGSTQEEYYPSDNGKYVEWGNPQQWWNNGMPHGEVGNALLHDFEVILPVTNLELPKEGGKERRSCLRLVLHDGARGISREQPIIVYATHLQHDSAKSRVDQMQYILERAKVDASTATVFIIGDLNDELTTGPAIGPVKLALESGFYDLAGLHAMKTGIPAPDTFPGLDARKRIDFIFCSKPLAVRDSGVVISAASDHRLTWVEVDIPFRSELVK